jgi:hypothetical protein
LATSKPLKDGVRAYLFYFHLSHRIAAAVTLKCRRAHHKKKAKGASLAASLQRRKIFFAYNMNGG